MLVILLAAHESAAESKNGFVLDDALVPPHEILNGGPGRDGIRSLDYPAFISANEATYLKSRDRVLGIELNGVARAYPIRILNYHEIVNDAFGGHAIVVTFCPLCNSGIAFNAEVDGTRLEFGVSGLLYNSDVLLYDRQTGSLWSQIEKTAITGTMKGTRLDALPMAHTTWRDWVARHPETEVLSDQTGFRRNYKVSPYPDYARNSALYFPVTAQNSKYRRKSLVLGLEIDGQFKAYPFSELRKSPREFLDEFQGQSFAVRYDKKNKTASIVGEDGDEWPTLISFWFAWYAFHPETEIYTAD
ncbi:MAG: DUF3179 domain-containing protein [Proteobacteria bacterium]|nr:DUF3179 domain-containing protein [Pseudomonadota bacterium]